MEGWEDIEYTKKTTLCNEWCKNMKFDATALIIPLLLNILSWRQTPHRLGTQLQTGSPVSVNAKRVKPGITDGQRQLYVISCLNLYSILCEISGNILAVMHHDEKLIWHPSIEGLRSHRIIGRKSKFASFIYIYFHLLNRYFARLTPPRLRITQGRASQHSRQQKRKTQTVADWDTKERRSCI